MVGACCTQGEMRNAYRILAAQYESCETWSGRTASVLKWILQGIIVWNGFNWRSLWFSTRDSGYVKSREFIEYRTTVNFLKKAFVSPSERITDYVRLVSLVARIKW